MKSDMISVYTELIRYIAISKVREARFAIISKPSSELEKMNCELPRKVYTTTESIKQFAESYPQAIQGVQTIIKAQSGDRDYNLKGFYAMECDDGVTLQELAEYLGVTVPEITRTSTSAKVSELKELLRILDECIKTGETPSVEVMQKLALLR